MANKTVPLPNKMPSQPVQGLQLAAQPRVDWTAIVNALKGLGPTVPGIADKIADGNLVGASVDLASLMTTPAWKALLPLAKSLGFETIGIVGGGEGAYIVGAQGMLGILTGTDDTSHYYFYKCAGISIGVQEGGAVTAGLYLHSEAPKDDWCVELFAGIGGTLVEGVSVEVFTTVDTGNGALLLLETGEELKVNFGACVATWSAINPDMRISQTVYVVDASAIPSTVTPIPTQSNQPGPAVTIPTELLGYQVAGVTPDGGTLYLMQKGGTTIANPKFVPISLDLKTPKVGTPFTVQLPGITSFEQPNVFTIDPDGENAYLLPLGEAVLIQVSLATTQVVGKAIRLPGAGDAMAITPDGSTAYVVNADGVVPVDLEECTVGTMIPVLHGISIAVSPDGKTAYVGTMYQGTYTVTPIVIETNTPGEPVPIDVWPQPMTITPDGKTLYIAGGSGVTPINLASKTLGTPIPIGVGHNSTLAITPDGQTGYVLYQTFNAQTNPNAGSELVPFSTTTKKPGTPILLNGVKFPTGIAIAL
jgi:hypothetical protein